MRVCVCVNWSIQAKPPVFKTHLVQGQLFVITLGQALNFLLSLNLVLAEAELPQHCATVTQIQSWSVIFQHFASPCFAHLRDHLSWLVTSAHHVQFISEKQNER